MGIRFHKMHGLGNDFIIIDDRSDPFEINSAGIVSLCDRRFGIGCDQLVIIQEADIPQASVRARFFNPDGSEAGACGNASRCVVKLLGGDAILQTQVGLLPGRTQPSGLIEVDMGVPQFDWARIPLAYACDTQVLPLPGHPAACSMGNPHVTFFDGIDAAPTLGPVMELDPLFPQRVNVGFTEVMSRREIRLRVWERGAGLTLACGSGACAAVVNAVRQGRTDRACRVILDGGELVIFFREDGHVLMTGPAAHVFEGVYHRD